MRQLQIMLMGWILVIECIDVHSADIAIAPFSADVTIPLGHRCMGILPTKSSTVDDPLFADSTVTLPVIRTVTPLLPPRVLSQASAEIAAAIQRGARLHADHDQAAAAEFSCSNGREE